MRIRFSSAVLAAALVSTFFISPVSADIDSDDKTTNIQFLGGMKVLNDNDWDPADEQVGFGVQFDTNPNDWPFNLAVGFKAAESGSEESSINGVGNVTSESRTTELMVGIRKYLQTEKLRPFLGVGLTVVRAELETTTPLGNDTDSGTGVGPYVGIGALYMVGDWLGLGGQLQYSTAKTDIFSESLDSGGIHADLLLDFSF